MSTTTSNTDLAAEAAAAAAEMATTTSTNNNNNNNNDATVLNSFWQRQAKRVARNPCRHLWASLVITIGLSVVAMIVGEFEVSAETGGWQSRGTMIADRHTQLMMANLHRYELFYGGEEAWENLINNVQPGWEDYDGSRRRRLNGDLNNNVVRVPQAREGEKGNQHLPFQLTPAMQRRLQEEFNDGSFAGCDIDFYTADSLIRPTRLWPVWRNTKASNTALDPEIIYNICVAEQTTLAYLEEKNLCFGCGEGKCLPPYSLVFYARLTVPDGMTMNCQELRDAWAPYQASVENEWKTCVENLKATYSPNNDKLPDSCPFGFLPTLIEESYDETLVSRYTSSIFPTHWYDIDELYEEVGNFDQGNAVVTGVYDTQYEDFVGLMVESSLTSDATLALLSAVVVAIAIITHTRSPLITVIGLVQIMLSFPLSYFVYKLLAGLEFFPFLNFIGIFVVFALGAGDVFVAVDKWRNARLKYPLATTEYVAAVALPNAASAMFLTTLTTAVAFFATAICPVAPIKMFAVFCGLLIIFDYIMNVLLVFPALCIYDKELNMKGPKGVNCCITCTCFGLLARKNGSNEATECTDDAKIDVENDTEDVEKIELNLIRRILLAYYRALHFLRWPLFILSIAAIALTAYFASGLELPTSSDVRMLDDSIQFEKNYLWRQNLLSEVLEKAGGSQAYLIWGVKAADTGVQTYPGSWSQLVLDDSFNPSSEEAQVFLSDFCNNTIFDEAFATTVEANYVCPIQRFDDWLVEQSSIENEMVQDSIYVQYCNQSTGIPVSPDYFDSCIVAWANQVGETSILSREGKVRILLFPFTSRVRYDDRYDTLDSEWNLIENWMQKQMNEVAPPGVNRAYFSSADFWWYDTNGQMLSTAYNAAGIALGCAAVVILFSSRSLLLTLFSTVTIGYVLTSVTATLVAMGWTMGFLEAICFAILIGVSVDFIIHFSHAYAMLKGTVNRSRRTKHALIEMGPSILATALTTILSAVIMFFTVITFFQKFALILFLTVIQASAGSFILFLTLVDCIGPTDPTYFVDRIILGKNSKEATIQGNNVAE